MLSGMLERQPLLLGRKEGWAGSKGGGQMHGMTGTAVFLGEETG